MTRDSWPPFENPDGTGISRDIIVKALAYSNSEAEFIAVPYARALRMTEKGLVDCVFNVTKQGSTTDKFIFGKEPLLQVKASYFYSLNNKMSYKAPADNTVAGVIIGYEYGNEYESHRHRFKEVKVSHQQQIIKMLIRDKIEVAIMFDKVAEFTLKEMHRDLDVIYKGHINHISDIYIGFSKEIENVDKKIQLLDMGLSKLKSYI
ncbi:transporter substrate-binding domain-containing protein [Pseudoalteromonas sp. C2R02]|uniref:substrate-binding periplasmic protein n=1 Tax=Pseudoalteromonas sp. C2R02 TaxID=2841565 RepID=UPI001C08DAAA|nr:transporter substrate-binding domain-containing protein [Pseudoalteromonas sp. C2R02]MBU2971983.1 transporter substrate-binding domain-containing protein [Pseudoalteromonas sp. C2R02]